MSPVRTVELPAPLAHQIDILDDPHRFKVVNAGRRFGKSTLGLVAVLDGHGPLVDGVPLHRGALHGARGFWVAPTFPIASHIWRELKGALAAWGGDLSLREQERIVEFPGGGFLVVKSAHDPVSMRGPGLNFVVVDEAAHVHEDAWTLALRPTLIDKVGWAMLISTPNGLNWFHDEFQKGNEAAPAILRDPQYRSWHRPTSANPAIPRVELARMQVDLGPWGWNTECLAEFQVRGGSMFQRDWFKAFRFEGDVAVCPDGTRWDRRSLYKFVTADFAWSVRTASDFRVYAVWGRSPDGRLFLLHVERGQFEAPSLVPRLVDMVTTWGAKAVFIEASGPLVRLNAEASRALPGLVFEDSIHAGTDAKDKVSRAIPAAAAVQSGRVLFLEGATWLPSFVSECCAFPDSDVHDDQVDCLSLAVRFSPGDGPPPLPSRDPPRPIVPNAPPWVGRGGPSWIRKRSSF